MVRITTQPLKFIKLVLDTMGDSMIQLKGDISARGLEYTKKSPPMGLKVARLGRW